MAKALVTPSIQKLADQITQGITNKRAQAEVLYRWVSTNIRYVAIFLDFGGVVPHDAQAILDARYGDCKDHVTVLEALLAAKGIKSSPVLLNVGTIYWLPNAAVAPGIFNHAISYLPELKLYADSTPGLAPFATLPVTEQGKTALVTDDGSGKPMLVTIPLYTPDSDGVDVTTKLVLDAQGNVTGSSEIKNRGAFDLISRQLFASFPPGVEPQIAGRVLTLSGQNGNGTYTHGAPRDLGAPFDYSTSFNLPDYAKLPGPGAITFPQGLNSFSGIAAAFELFAPEKRELSMPFVGRRVTETISMVSPEGMRVPTLPKQTKVTAPMGSFESSYSSDGRTISVKRRLDITMKGPLVEPADYTIYRAMAQDVLRSLRAQLVY